MRAGGDLFGPSTWPIHHPAERYMHTRHGQPYAMGVGSSTCRNTHTGGGCVLGDVSKRKQVHGKQASANPVPVWCKPRWFDLIACDAADGRRQVWTPSGGQESGWASNAYGHGHY